MSSTFFGAVFDTIDPPGLAAFCREVLGYVTVAENDAYIAIARDRESYPGLTFVRSPAAKQGKNRLHLDLVPDDQDKEVARLIDLGASRVDVGQGVLRRWGGAGQ